MREPTAKFFFGALVAGGLLAACGSQSAAPITVTEAVPTTVTQTVSTTVTAGQGDAQTARPTASGTSPAVVNDPDSIVVTVDCGDDGVANVRVQYGTSEPEVVLVGRSATTQGAGGETSFSGTYGTAPGAGDGDLTVVVAPTKGTCESTLTSSDNGNVLAQRKSAGKVTLEGLVRE